MPKKIPLKQSIVPEFVETKNYTAGWHRKLQQDEIPEGAATGDSYNFILDYDGKWTTRGGTKYLGTKSTDTGGCTSSAKLVRRDGVELPIVFYGTKSKYFNPVSLDWEDLEDGFTSGLIFGKAVAEKSTDNINRILFCNGTDDMRSWSGITGKVASFTTNTITLDGNTDLTDRHFDQSGTLVANGITYSYQGIKQYAEVYGTSASTVTVSGDASLATLGFTATGTFVANKITYTYTGLSGNTFTGVTPNPTIAFGPIVDNVTSTSIDKQSFTPATPPSPFGFVDLGFTTPNSVIINGNIFNYTSIDKITASPVLGVSYVGVTLFGVTPDPTNIVHKGDVISPTKLNIGDKIVQTGITANAFIGISPDPTGNLAAGDTVIQGPVSDSTLPKGNILAALNGRVCLFTKPTDAILGGGSIVGSQLNDYTNFLFSSPRVASEGFQLLMAEGGGNGTGMIQFEGGLACFKQNALSKLSVTLDQYDSPSIVPLLPYDESCSGHIGCVGPKALCALGNQVFFVSPRKNILSLQRVSQIDFPQALPFSDRIKNAVNEVTWDGDSCAFGFDYFAEFCGKIGNSSVPNKRFVYDQRFDAWWTPLIGVEISSYFVFNGKPYATLASSPDVVELNVGTTDFASDEANGQPINAKLILGRRNFGKKSKRKQSHQEFIEGWMSKAGTVTFTFSIDENGKTFRGTLRGDGDQYFFDLPTGGEFAEAGFGAETFGGVFDSTSELPDGVGHFRVQFNFPKTSYWNSQLTIETSSYFKLITNAPQATISPVAIPGSLKSKLT